MSILDSGIVELTRFILITLLLIGGLLFTLVSAIGVLRLPDIYSRSHMATETDTLGTGMTLAAVALALGWHSQTVLTILLLLFIFITNPTAAHAIARAAMEEGHTPYVQHSAPEQPRTLADHSRGDTNGR